MYSYMLSVIVLGISFNLETGNDIQHREFGHYDRPGPPGAAL